MTDKKSLRFLSLSLVYVLLFSVLPLPTQAANVQSDWRRTSGAPTLTFYDTDGNRIPELTEIYAGDSALSFDASKVSYSKANIEQLNYSFLDLSFTLIDYDCHIEEEALLPLASDFTAELSFGDTMVAIDSSDRDRIDISRDTSNYLKLTLTFFHINPFLNNNNQVSLFIQYLMSEETETKSNKCRANLNYEFSRMILPPDSEDREKADQEKMDIEIILPESETSIRSETPYIIITKRLLNDGAASVSAGSTFSLTISGQNSHSKLSIDNVLMQVSCSDDLQLEHPSHSFYIGDIEKGDSFEQTINITISPTASSGSHSISLHFDYEYVDGNARRYDSINHQVSIPVSQSLRFVLSPVDTLSEYVCGEKHSIYSSCANLSHSDIYNVSAALSTDLSSPQKTIYLGNLRSGSAATAHFTVLSSEVGSFPATITYYYEDLYGQTFSESRDFSMTFVAPPVDEDEWTAPEITTTIPAASSTQASSKTEQQPYFLSTLLIASVLFISFFFFMDSLIKKEK